MLVFIRSTITSFWTAAVTVILGILLVVFPSASVTIFCTGAGIALIVYGLTYLFRYWQGKRQNVSLNTELFFGLVLIILGLLFLAVPKIIFSILPFMLGALLLLTGLCKIPLVRDALKIPLPHAWLFFLSALIPVILGLILLFNPFGAVTSLIVFFGICLIVNGALDIFGYFFSRNKLQK